MELEDLVVFPPLHGIAQHRIGLVDQLELFLRQFVAPVDFDRGESWEPSAETFVSVQNAGAVDGSVTIWAQADASCTPSRCRDLTIRPGESVTVPAEDCGTGRWRGAMWATSDVPIAVVADTVSADAVDGDVLTTYEGVTDALTHDAVGMPVRDTAAAVLYGPLIVDPRYGWASRISVQNLSETDPTNVTVTFLDRAGEILDSTGGQLCAHASGTFSLVATDWSGVRLIEMPWLYERLPSLIRNLPGSGSQISTTLAIFFRVSG